MSKILKCQNLNFCTKNLKMFHFDIFKPQAFLGSQSTKKNIELRICANNLTSTGCARFCNKMPEGDLKGKVPLAQNFQFWPSGLLPFKSHEKPIYCQTKNNCLTLFTSNSPFYVAEKNSSYYTGNSNTNPEWGEVSCQKHAITLTSEQQTLHWMSDRDIIQIKWPTQVGQSSYVSLFWRGFDIVVAYINILLFVHNII